MSRASGLSPFASCQFRFSHALLRIACLSLLSLCYVYGEVTTLEARLPSFESSQPDSYFCMSIDISDKPQQLMGVEALAHKETVHHILLFGCEAPSSEQPYWPCREHGGTCGSGEQTILFGWGQDAPPFRYEEGRSMSVGEGTKMSTIVMQVHFLTARPKDDASGVKLTLSDKAVDRAIGMIDFIASFTIPPGLPQYDVPVECCYRGWEPVQPYAIRVHAHDLAKEIWLDDPYRRSETAPDGGHVRLYTGDPSLPQSFYRVQEGGHPVRPILPGQTMQAICRYNSSTRTQHVHAGWTHADEMCNLYMMAESQLPVFSNCFNFRSHQDPHAEGGLPRPSEMQELPQADAPLLQWAADAGAQAGGWQGIGQVSAVHEAPDGTVWLLHRGEREWDGTTFDEQNRMRDRSMIAADVIVQLNASSGTVLRSFGAGWLSMPHGLTVDWDGNLWITDCGLHQVIKVDPEKQEKVLEIGTQLEPGHDLDHFCKPTNVAPGTDGTVWVSDGYCNARLLQLSSKDGKVLQEVPLEMDALRQPQSRVIHDVVLNECDQRAYVADREEGKILVAPLNEKAPELAVAADLSHLGIVWGLALGPYGTVWALVQKRGKETSLVVLEERAMGRLQELRSYKIENSGDSPIPEPHDLALGAAPSWITGPRTRYIALYITETGGESYAPQPGQPPADHVHGRLRKMVLTHAGFQLPSAGAAPVKTSAPDADPGATPAATRAAGVTPAATAQPEAAPQSSSAAGSELSSAPADEAAAPDPASSRALPAGPQHAGTGSSILQQPPASAAGEQKAAAAAAAPGESGGGADDGHAAPATPPDGTGGGTAFQVAGFRRGPAFGAGLAKSGRPMEEGINPGVALMLLVTGMAVTALAVHLWQNANGDRPVQYHPVSSAPGPQSARPHLSAQGH